MKELEVKTYNFAVQGIGLTKSLEKEFPELANTELKQSMGAVSIDFMDALNAEENEGFARKLRSCFEQLKKSGELLQAMGAIENPSLNEQKIALIQDSKYMIEKLDSIICKLIY